MLRRPFVALALALSVLAAITSAAGPVQAPPVPASQASPTRDVNQARTRQIPIGSGSVSGVVTAADSGQPLARARVVLLGMATAGETGRIADLSMRGGITATASMAPLQTGTGPPGGPSMSRTIVTDPQGRFTFVKVPAGRYTLSISREQYLPMNYGQKTFNRPGTTISLAESQQIVVKIGMQRGGVLTGTIVNEDGEGAVNAQVRALRYQIVSGFRRLQQVGGANTDDRGVYRIHGLQPGEYLVSASSNASMATDRSLADAAEVESTIAAARLTPVAPGQLTTISIPVVPPSPAGAQPAGFAPTYHPSAAELSGASAVMVGAGEEKTNVDVRLLPIRAGNIQGTVLNPGGQAGAVQISMIADDPAVTGGMPLPSARTNPDGTFVLRNIPPGQYTLVAQSVPPPQPGAANNAATTATPLPPQNPAQAPRLWGRVSVSVDGQSVTDVAIQMQPGRSISGRIVFDTSIPADLSRTRLMVNLMHAPSPQPFAVGQTPQAQVSQDGRFTLTGVAPGRYVIRAVGGAPASVPLVQKSSIVDGRDTLDFPLDFTSGNDIDDVVITMTDRPSLLSGRLTDGAGKPGSDYQIVLLPAETRFWTPGARRILVTRPGPDGRYMFRNLPAGDYLLAAVTDLEPGIQYDPEFLQSLAGASLRVSVADGAERTQDLRVAK